MRAQRWPCHRSEPTRPETSSTADESGARYNRPENRVRRFMPKPKAIGSSPKTMGHHATDIGTASRAHAAPQNLRSPESEAESFGSLPLLRNYLRYYSHPITQIEAEGAFMSSERRCREYLESLRKAIVLGDVNGLRELMLLAHDATKLLNRIAETEPDFVAVAAEHYNTWPILWNGGSFSKDQRYLLEKVRLSWARPNIATRKRIGQDPPLSRKWALLLLESIEILRSLAGAKDHPNP
jgi:hypothetical protein